MEYDKKVYDDGRVKYNKRDGDGVLVPITGAGRRIIGSFYLDSKDIKDIKKEAIDRNMTMSKYASYILSKRALILAQEQA